MMDNSPRAIKDTPPLREEGQMAEKTLTEMSEDDFQTMIDEYIERSSRRMGEMPASTFFALLFEKAAQRAAKTVEVEGRIESGQL